MWILPWFG